MKLTRVTAPLLFYLLVILSGLSAESPVFSPRIIGGISPFLSIASASDYPAGVQGGGAFIVSGGVNITNRLGFEVGAGASGTLDSLVTGNIIYNGYSGFLVGLDTLYNITSVTSGNLSLGAIAGIRGHWMALSSTRHFFFFPGASLGTYLNLRPHTRESWYIRLALRYHQQFRRDLAYAAAVELSLSIVQESL